MYRMTSLMKNLLYISVLFFLLVFGSKAEIVKSIKIDGNERVSDETIILFSKVNVNDNVNSNNLNDIIKKLYSTNFFQDIKVSFDNGNLLISVIENPVIQTVEFKGIKKKSILEVLKDNIELKEKNSFMKNIVKRDEEKITNILKTNGYYFAEVKTKIKENDNNTIDIIFDIVLGEKAFIKRIKFIGDKKIKDRKLRNIIISEEAKFWKFISSRKFLDIKRIRFDEKLLNNYYKNNGYYNVKVESSSAKIINETDFELIFNINAGEKYYFGNLKLDIPDEYSSENFKDLNNVLTDLKGETYSLNKLEEVLSEIDKIVLQQEFQFINAKYTEDVSQNNLINIKIKLEELEKLYIERIDILGNFITEEKVIRNSLLIDEGDAYNKILWNKSVNEIKSRNIFDNVTSKVKSGTSEKNKILEVEVEEKPTGEISAGAGTGTSGSSLSFGLRENNYLGKGIKINTALVLSDTSITGRFEVNNPNYNNSDRSLNTRFETSETDLMTKYGYKSNKTGFSLGTSYEQFQNIYFSPNISTYYESLKTSSNASASKKKQEGDYFDTEFSYGLTLNKLNQNFQPSDGYRSSFSQTLPIYTEDLAIENSYQFSKYHQLKDDMVFSFNFLAKAVNSISSEDVRVTKRVFLPGRKLRGFEVGKIGPQDGGDYIGGNYGSAINLATTLPQLFPDLQEIDFSLFLDAANVWGVDYNSSLDKSSIRSSTGIAVDWFTPIGPLSFSFAQPLSKSSSDQTEKFRFNIGTTF